jgi:ABC-type branched-subunit amino acid transport system ATPase component
MRFDIRRNENHNLVTTVTEHPVETGADIADHVRDELDRFNIEGYVTDTPTNQNRFQDDVFERRQNVGTIKNVEIQIPDQPFLLGVSSAIGAGLNALGSLITGALNPPKARILTFDDFKSRVKIVARLLDDLRRSHKLVRIITGVYEYDNMLLEQLDVSQSVDDGRGATFSCSFKEIRTVESEITAAPSPAEALGQSQKAAGSKSAEADKETADSKKKSFLAKAVDESGKYLEEDGGLGGVLGGALGL